MERDCSGSDLWADPPSSVRSRAVGLYRAASIGRATEPPARTSRRLGTCVLRPLPRSTRHTSAPPATSAVGVEPLAQTPNPMTHDHVVPVSAPELGSAVATRGASCTLLRTAHVSLVPVPPDSSSRSDRETNPRLRSCDDVAGVALAATRAVRGSSTAFRPVSAQQSSAPTGASGSSPPRSRACRRGNWPSPGQHEDQHHGYHRLRDKA